MAPAAAALARRPRAELLCCTALAALLHGGLALALLPAQPAAAVREPSVLRVVWVAAPVRAAGVDAGLANAATAPAGEVFKPARPVVASPAPAAGAASEELAAPPAQAIVQVEPGSVFIAYPDAGTPGGRLELSARLDVGDAGWVRHVQVGVAEAPDAFAAAVAAAFHGQALSGPHGPLDAGPWCAAVSFIEEGGEVRWRITGRARPGAADC